jgi:hypothetical protein
MEKLGKNARRAADLVDRVPGLIEAGAVPDPDVLRAYEARRVDQNDLAERCCQTGR